MSILVRRSFAAFDSSCAPDVSDSITKYMSRWLGCRCTRKLDIYKSVDDMILNTDIESRITQLCDK